MVSSAENSDLNNTFFEIAFQAKDCLSCNDGYIGSPFTVGTRLASFRMGTSRVPI